MNPMVLWLFVIFSVIVTHEINIKQKRNLNNFIRHSNQLLVFIVLCEVILCYFSNKLWVYEFSLFNIIYIALNIFVLLTV